MSIVVLEIHRFRSRNIIFGFLGMMLLRFPLWMEKKCVFWKLLGCGKDASVHLAPDFKHWGMLTVWNQISDAEYFTKKSFPARWFRFFSIESYGVQLEPLAAHGFWDGQQPFTVTAKMEEMQPIAVLTRARIRMAKVKTFQNHILKAQQDMENAAGFLLSAGIGEMPFLRQATFSIWENAESMKKYAYQTANHAQIIQKTRAEKWYSEELFARFKILKTWGTLNGKNPL